MDKYTHCRGVQSSVKLGKIPRRKSRWGNSCGRAFMNLKGPKGGMTDGLFSLLRLAEIDIYVLRGFFFSPAEIHILISKPQLTCA